tara:strand:+ start:1292 stop:2242 length:951 start_codon:yes stop_codon:yes gene_type:complete
MNLIHGDCLAELKNLPDKSVDMVYLDLPYGQTACKWDIKIDLIALWIELRRVARSERTAFFFSCTTKFGFELFNHAPKGYFRWDLVWEKNRAAGFLHAYKMPMRKHEMVYCFAKKSPAYDVSSHSEVEIQPHIRKNEKDELTGGIRSTKRQTHKERLPTSILPPEEDHELIYCFAKKSPAYDVSSHSEVDIQKNGRKTPKNAIYGRHNIKTEDKVNKVHKERLPTSVLPEQEAPSSWCKYDVDAKTKHRTSKPIKLMQFLLKYWSKEGDTILDPTMGSGTMGVACKNMNRNFIGIEMSEEFYNLAKERISAVNLSD